MRGRLWEDVTENERQRGASAARGGEGERPKDGCGDQRSARTAAGTDNRRGMSPWTSGREERARPAAAVKILSGMAAAISALRGRLRGYFTAVEQ